MTEKKRNQRNQKNESGKDFQGGLPTIALGIIINLVTPFAINEYHNLTLTGAMILCSALLYSLSELIVNRYNYESVLDFKESGNNLKMLGVIGAKNALFSATGVAIASRIWGL